MVMFMAFLDENRSVILQDDISRPSHAFRASGVWRVGFFQGDLCDGLECRSVKPLLIFERQIKAAVHAVCVAELKRDLFDLQRSQIVGAR